jgi:hypothetical protein
LTYLSRGRPDHGSKCLQRDAASGRLEHCQRRTARQAADYIGGAIPAGGTGRSAALPPCRNSFFGLCADLAEAIAGCLAQRPDMVLLDAAFRDGPTAVRRLIVRRTTWTAQWAIMRSSVEAKVPPVMGDVLRKRRHGRGHHSGQSWYTDETYLKVQGRWCYLYRAIDRVFEQSTGTGSKDGSNVCAASKSMVRPTVFAASTTNFAISFAAGPATTSTFQPPAAAVDFSVTLALRCASCRAHDQ